MEDYVRGLLLAVKKKLLTFEEAKKRCKKE